MRSSPFNSISSRLFFKLASSKRFLFSSDKIFGCISEFLFSEPHGQLTPKQSTNDNEIDRKSSSGRDSRNEEN